MKLKITALGFIYILFNSASIAQNVKELFDIQTGDSLVVFSNIVNYNNDLYFTVPDENEEGQLWRRSQNGVATQVVNLNPGGRSNISNLFVFNGKLLFQGNDGIHGIELWEYDGVNPPTMIMDMNPGIQSTNVSNITVFGNRLFFDASISPGNELWMYDGINQPAPFNQFYPGTDITRPGPRIVHNGILYFFMENSGIFDYDFWKFDGTTPPTIIPSYDSDLRPGSIAVYDKKFLISGTNTSLRKIAFFDEINSPVIIDGDYTNPFDLITLGDTLYFTAYSDDYGKELFKYSSSQGVKLAADIATGTASSQLRSPVNIDGSLYFYAVSPTLGNELGRYSPTTGFEFVTDINPNGNSIPNSPIKYGKKIVFKAFNGGDAYGSTLWSYDPRPCVTDVSSNEITCSELENLCVPLTFTGGQGIISMDFSFAYDPNKMTFSGAPTLGAAANSDHFDVLTFEETPGNIRGVVYLKSGAPASAQLNGPNELLCLNFDAANARNGDVLDFSYTDIEVGSLTETTEGCETDPAEITVTNTQFGGQLRYAGINNNNRKIGDLDSSPLNSITTISGIQGDCTAPTGTPINLTPDGFFTYNTDNGTSIQIIRDINNSTPVNAAINSADVLATNKIILGITSTPSISSLISADVNQDGRVTSVDASLISLRSTLSIEEYNHSKDWVFVLKEDLSNDPALLNATRHSVPVLPPCISLSALFSQGCIDPTQPSDIAGFLLGDVNLTWRNNNSASHLKTESPGTVTLHFDQIEELDQFNYSIPISFNSEMDIKSIDFDIDYNEERISISDFVSENNANSSFWNDYNQSRFFGGLYNIDGLDENDAILSLIVKKKSGTPVPEDFITTVAYITDQEAKIAFENQVTGMDEFETFPTPASHELHIQSNSGSIINSNIVITDLNGRSILEFPKTDLSDLSINVSSLSPGIYLLHINQSVKKIFID